MATVSRAAMQRWSVPGRLREAFLGGDRATARVYLQNLVDHIVVGEDEIIIEARAGAALAMKSAAGTTAPEAAKGEVLADVVDWRPQPGSNHRLWLLEDEQDAGRGFPVQQQKRSAFEQLATAS